MVARVAALGALALAIALVALVLLGGGSTYTLRADFRDAGQLVTGNQVLIGPAAVGTIQSVTLTPNGAAEVTMSLDSSAAPVPQGTIARVYENSLSGIANKYVVLEPGPRNGPPIPNGGLIGEDHTQSFVALDQLFDTFNPLTRAGLSNFIKGEAASIQGRARAANQTLRYFAPALQSTSDVTAQLSQDEPTFDALLVQGAQAMQLLASRSQQLTQLVANTNATTGAIASQSQALEQTLSLFPGALTQSTTAFQGLNATLDKLDPLVVVSKVGIRRLEPFSAGLRRLVNASIPTVGQLDALIHNPSGTGDLTTLARSTPSLARTAETAFRHLIQSMNNTQNQLDTLREYAPDVVAALTNLGQAGAYYDANGHYVRTQPVFNAFSVDGFNQLEPQPPSNRYNGLSVVHGRCPGAAVQPTPDGSAPWTVPGCSPSAVPPGP
ncbi:MAG TPA: MlaD family protein [Solirubrobacteraceae bacterium]|nr:MlaD family protein [Solirubrobacteraceae bacterium]